MSLHINQVYKYLTKALFPNEPYITHTLSDRRDFKVLGYYVGIKQLDPDNVIYIHTNVLNRLALNKLDKLNSVEKIIDVGGLFSTEVMIVVRLKDEYNKTREKFLQGKYSEMFNSKQLLLITKHNWAGSDFLDVVTKSEFRRKKLESKYNCKIEPSTELDEMIHLDREIYEYEHVVDPAVVLE